MFSRKLLVGAMVAVGGAALAAKALLADKELRDDAKEKGKKLAKDAEEFVDSLGKVANDTASKVVDSGKKIVNEFKEAAEEAKEKLNEDSKESTNNTESTDNSESADTDDTSDTADKDVNHEGDGDEASGVSDEQIKNLKGFFKGYKE